MTGIGVIEELQMSRENNDSKICSFGTTYYIYIHKLILSLAYTKINPQSKIFSCIWKIDLNLKNNMKSSIPLQGRDVRSIFCMKIGKL